MALANGEAAQDWIVEAQKDPTKATMKILRAYYAEKDYTCATTMAADHQSVHPRNQQALAGMFLTPAHQGMLLQQQQQNAYYCGVLVCICIGR